MLKEFVDDIETKLLNRLRLSHFKAHNKISKVTLALHNISRI